MSSLSSKIAVTMLATTAMLLAVAPAGAEGAVRSMPAATGKSVAPPAGLAETAGRLRAAAAAKDADAVFALIADDVTFVSSGITLGVARRVEKKSFTDADTALAAIGGAFTEGEIALPAGKRLEPQDLKKGAIATALKSVAEILGEPRWGRDPLVVGGYCTAPGAKWDAEAAKKAGIGGSRGVFVTAETKLFAEASNGAKVVGKLVPERIYVDEGARDDGWTQIGAAKGTVWAAPESVAGAMAWGLCFLPDGQGGWLMSAVVSALN